MAAPPVAAGSIAASSRRRGATSPPAASKTAPASGRTTAAGAGRGPPTAASSTIAPPPTPRAIRGRSANGWSGGITANDGKGQWVGYDVPDFVRDKAPESQRVVGGKGAAGLTGAEPFIMQSDGRGWLFAPSWRQGWPAARPLRADGVAAAQCDVPAAEQSGGGGVRPTR